MALFDEIVLSKRNRGRSSIFSGRSTTDFLSDTSNHLWRTASATFFAPSSRSQPNLSGDYSRVVQRGKFLTLSRYPAPLGGLSHLTLPVTSQPRPSLTRVSCKNPA